ncbi:hypothetical protein Patl1_11814 [Pistacia atlantica]|uniref:Uncharacterized protein n=1 Tax=Pistacia atlantica TaxID=434234 RepID=A0ACC1A351_9ROSI|nr:hypothetical protein Patl1_11814 [Pistacia atlantica]
MIFINMHQWSAVQSYLKSKLTMSHEDDSMPKVWNREVDIKTILKDSWSTSLRVLSDIVVIQFDDKPDRIKTLLFSSLMSGTIDVLASNTWEKFKEETKYVVKQAMLAQEAHKPHNNWLPSPWALALVVAGLFGFARRGQGKYEKLVAALTERAKYLFVFGCEGTWALGRSLLELETEVAALGLLNSIVGFEFFRVFNHDDDSVPKVWTREVDIKTILKNVQSTSLRVLLDMVVICLDEKLHRVKNLPFSSLMSGTVVVLATNAWEVSPSNMLKSPMECMYLWD